LFFFICVPCAPQNHYAASYEQTRNKIDNKNSNISIMLNNRFFTRETAEVHNDQQYVGWSCKYARSTMVLFSRQTATPLAALVLTAPKDPGVLTMITARPKESIPHFQGMLSMPGQVFQLSIVNLQPDMINFNVLHSPEYKVDCKDPGPQHGVNRVNELRGFEAYSIPCDQRTQKEMVLEGQTKRDVASNRDVPVTVQEDEAKGKHKESTDFFLSVVPCNQSQSLIDKFKEGTVWKSVSHFVTQSAYVEPQRRQAGSSRGVFSCGSSMPAIAQVEDEPAPVYRSFGIQRVNWQSTHMQRGTAQGLEYSDCSSPPQHVSFNSTSEAATRPHMNNPHVNHRLLKKSLPNRQFMPAGGPRVSAAYNSNEVITTMSGSFGSAAASPAVTSAAASPAVTAAAVTNRAPVSLTPAMLSLFRTNEAASGPASSMADRIEHPKDGGPEEDETNITANIFDDGAEEELFEEEIGVNEVLERQTESVVVSNPVKPVESKSGVVESVDVDDVEAAESSVLHAAVDVKSTQAGKLAYGANVQEQSGTTNAEYAYDYPSDPVVLSLSIWRDMQFLPLPDFVVLLKECIQDKISGEGKQILASLNQIFETEDQICVIDLESRADTVLCMCGHKCLAQKNVAEYLKTRKSCPLCRQPISTTILESGLIVS
jgi:hypothetical protein